MEKGYTITEMVKDAHANAAEKGFWDEYPHPATCIALMHSELSEALEKMREGAFPHEATTDFNTGKPIGVGIELADTVIRIADFCGAYGINLEQRILEKMEYNKGRERLHGKLF